MLTTHYMEEAERLADDLIIIDHGRVIARGSPPEIIASLGAESIVRFSLAGSDPRALSEQELQALDGVRSARYSGAEITLSVVHTQAVIAGLFDLIKRRELELEDLNTHRPTLEDVFVSLTGKLLVDD